MNAVADTLGETIRLEFDLACRDLLEAEAAVRDDDRPLTRRRLDACRAEVDAVLDMWNEAAPAVYGFVGGVGDGTGRPAPEPRCP
jgi:hypothetical protein